NRGPDSYVYLNREELKRYYAYHMGACGVLDAIGKENTVSKSLGLNGGITASAGDTCGDSKHYKIPPEILFESVEGKLRKDFIRLNGLNELTTDSYVWVNCNLDTMGGTFSNKTKSLNEHVMIDLFGSKTQLLFEKEYFSPMLQSYFKSLVPLNCPVEMLCKIVKHGDIPFVTPMVILKRN
ncbi:MAG: hypothetical protein GY852_01840, partial [bacterium]|nr:hypothetical protein [bacterium]